MYAVIIINRVIIIGIYMAVFLYKKQRKYAIQPLIILLIINSDLFISGNADKH